ncbi:hypothetical protein ACP3S7_27225 [Phytobacter ursingii]
MLRSSLLFIVLAIAFLSACSSDSYNNRVYHPNYQKLDVTDTGQKVIVSERNNSRFIITYLYDEKGYCSKCAVYKVAAMNKSDHPFDFGVRNFDVKNGATPVMLMSSADVSKVQDDKMSSHNTFSMISGLLMGVAAGLAKQPSVVSDYTNSLEQTTQQIQNESDFINNKFSNESLNEKRIAPGEGYGGVIIAQNLNFDSPLFFHVVIDNEVHDVEWNKTK